MLFFLNVKFYLAIQHFFLAYYYQPHCNFACLLHENNIHLFAKRISITLPIDKRKNSHFQFFKLLMSYFLIYILLFKQCNSH